MSALPWRQAAPVVPSPFRRVTLAVHVVLELPEDLTGYFQDESEATVAEIAANPEGLRNQLAAEFAGFVQNEIDNCPEYGVDLLHLHAEVTEVSA